MSIETFYEMTDALVRQTNYPSSSTVNAKIESTSARILRLKAMTSVPAPTHRMSDTRTENDVATRLPHTVAICTLKENPRIRYLSSAAWQHVRVREVESCDIELPPPLQDRKSTSDFVSAPLSFGNITNSSDALPTITWPENVETSSVSSTTLQQDIISRISTLRTLVEQGFLSTEEYERRKTTIVDEVTYSSHSIVTATRVPMVTHSGTPSRRGFQAVEGAPTVRPHAPDFRNVVPEVATKHVFDYDTRQWHSLEVYVCLDEVPFGKGSLRVVHHLLDLNELNGQSRTYVAKLAIDPNEDPQTYFRDIETQAHCAYYARLYNSYNPPKRVEFIQAWILELVERKGALCAVEPYIEGEYRKHNNNFGCVSEEERNTPQAFSHFTYEASNHEILAVDIQGVGDLYTDPQIHTLNGSDFGRGNLGVLGFQKFLSSHRCNSICRYLKLPPVNPKDRKADDGTVPMQELMNKDCVRKARFESRHYYENAPMLQKYISQCRELESRNSQNETITWTSPIAHPISTRFDCAQLSTWCCCIQ